MIDTEINSLLESGIKNHQENRLDEAVNYYEKVLNKDNRNFKANLFLGIVFAQQKKLLDAEKQFKKSLEIDPENFEIFNNLGLVYKELNQIDKSIESFNKAIKLNPNFIIAYNNLGLIYQNSNQTSEAEKIFIKAIKIEPNDLNTNINLAILYKNLSKKDKAEKLFIKILSQNPRNIIALINYGILLKNIGEKNKSEKYLKKAIEINPKYFPAYNNLMVLYERTNQNQKLKEVIEKAHFYFPNNKFLKLFQAHYHYKIEDYEKSLLYLKDISFDKNELRYEKLKNLLLAKNYDKIGDIDSAFQNFEKTNEISYDLKDKDINKDNALKIITKRIQYFKNYQNSNPNNLKNNLAPIFLIGFPRSGTTLLDTILRSHQEVSVLEEKPATTMMLNEIQKIIKGDFNNLEKIKDDEIEILQKNYFDNLNNFIDKKKFSKIIIDKMPLNIVHVGEIVRVFPNAKFILALRHPCDCVLSCFMQNFKLNDSMANFLSIEDTAKMYDLVMTLWKQYTNSFSINYHYIKYEDVVMDFDKSINNLLNFLELPWSKNVLKFYETAQSRNLINTPSYDQVYKPIYTASRYRWKKYENKIDKVLPVLRRWIDEFKY